MDIRITLGHRSVGFDLFNRNLLMSGPVSKRRDHFPFVIQNDLPLEKEMMGGGYLVCKVNVSESTLPEWTG